jgi:glycosyltransferase involved in cell wall biosynthesis
VRRIKPDCRVIGIANGVDVDRFSPGPSSSAGLALRNGFSTVVAILGHVSEVKGYPVFVDAAARLAPRYPECLFVAIGGETAQPGYTAKLESRVRALGLAERFRFLGFRADVGDLLRAVDIVALPSLAEGLPLAALEVMAAGKPIVATRVGGVPEAVCDGVTGLLVRPNDSDALTAAIESLIARPEQRRSLGNAARSRALEKFSVRVFARRVQEIYEAVDY